MSEPLPLLMNTKAGALHAEAGQQQLERMSRDIGLEINVIRTE